MTTWGFPTVSSNPSRRICSTSTASWSSPRPWTSQASGRVVGPTRSDTLPTNSASSLLFTRRAVSLVPSVPASGDVLMPMVMARLGSSTVMAARGRGSSGSDSVSPMVISAMPATAAISPGPAVSVSTRSRASLVYSSVIFTFSAVPSSRHQLTVAPFRSVPLCTRQTARRPT